jgi:glycosyltransferase involved in cell wall biosynthesis
VTRAPASVLLVHSSSGRYGADRQLRLIATGLDRERYRPLVALPADGPLVDDLREAGVEVLVRPLAVLRREHASVRGAGEVTARLVRDTVALGRLVHTRRLALVHSNTSVVLGGASAATVGRIPHVWHVREIYDRFGALWPPYRSLLERAAALPCVSRATASQFGALRRVRVIPDGLASDPVRAPRDVARAALGLDADAAVIAVLGRVSEWKGQDVLVRALVEEPLRDRGAIALLAGEAWPGAERRADAVLELARTLGVSDRVRMLGFRDDVDTVLGAADVIAVPSTSPDPLPGAAIEAAAAGCAVLASAHGGLPEIIRDRVTGRLVAPRDPRALASAAAELLDDPRKRDRLGAAAAVDVRERYSARRLLDSVQNLYDELLASPDPAAASARA